MSAGRSPFNHSRVFDLGANQSKGSNPAGVVTVNQFFFFFSFFPSPFPISLISFLFLFLFGTLNVFSSRIHLELEFNRLNKRGRARWRFLVGNSSSKTPSFEEHYEYFGLVNSPYDCMLPK